MHKITLLLLAVVCTIYLQAQNVEDVVRYSRILNLGTARSAAMGGAFCALGGDISSTNYNPAGIGVFRQSEASITPYLNFNKMKSGELVTKDRSVQPANFGVVMSFYKDNEWWNGLNIGLSYTGTNNFNRKTRQFIANSENSRTDVWAAESQGIPAEELIAFTTGLAYDTKLTYQDARDGKYYSVLNSGVAEPVNQSRIMKEDGFQGELTLSVGTNFREKLYLGAAVGISILSYKMHSSYNEIAQPDSPSGLDFYQFDEYQKTQGAGIGLKLGAIYRPIPALRIGIALHSPTWDSLGYKMWTNINAQYLRAEAEIDRYQMQYNLGNEPLDINYKSRTPWRLIFGVATVPGKRLILSADYEYVNYRTARLKEDSYGYLYKEENKTIKAYLTSAHNLRLGAEYRVSSILSLRTGYALQHSPYHEDNKTNERLQLLSAGFGLNFGLFYCDAAYAYKTLKNRTVFYAYTHPEDARYDFSSQTMDNRYTSHEFFLTLGVRFRTFDF